MVNSYQRIQICSQDCLNEIRSSPHDEKKTAAHRNLSSLFTWIIITAELASCSFLLLSQSRGHRIEAYALKANELYLSYTSSIAIDS